MRQYNFILVIFLSFKTFSAQSQDINTHHLTSADGLTSNTIINIFQDSRGFLWISTEDGLNMYDGQTVKQYYLSDYISSQAYSNFTGGIAEDVDHNILIAAKSGIVKFSWNTKQFIVVYKNDFAAFGNVYPELFVDKKKNIWICERVRIKQFDAHFHLLRTWYLHDSSNAKYLNGPSVTSIAGEDGHHRLWLNDYSYILTLNELNGKTDTLNGKLNNADFRNSNLYAVSASANSVWVIRNNYTLIHFNTDLNSIASYHLPATIYPSYKSGIESNNKYWLGTYQDGVCIINKQTGEVQNFLVNQKNNAALSSNSISCLLKDATENIWIGTNAGVNEWSANASFFHQLNFNIPDSLASQQYGLQNIFVQNNILFAFTSFGLIRSQLINNSSKYFIDNTRYYTAGFPFNNQWLVCRSHHVEFLQVKNNQLIFSEFTSPHTAILDSSDVVSFYKDDDKNIWMGLSNDAGIICWNTSNNNFHIYNQKSKGKNFCPLRHFRYAIEDSKKNIWFGYEKGGIAIFDKQRQQFISPPLFEKDSINNVVVSGMINDNKNHLWIATNTGLIRYDELKNSYQRFSRKEGLPSNNVLGIEQDATGNIWAGFEGALAEINILTNNIITYSTADGLPDEQLQNPLYDSVSTTMFFCTDRNIIYFNPQQIKKTASKLNTVITSLQVMGKEQSFYAGKKIELPYSQNYLLFNFSAANFINASENEYACKLDGADKNWNYLGNHHFANYSQLQPGNYIFHVKARVKNGAWQEESAPVIINILTPFWRTAWFWVLCVAILLCIIFSFVYLRLRNKFEKQILAQSIRDKIAGDLHDDIGSTLSSVTILSELAKQKYSDAAPLLERISKSISSVQENMSDIVWAINPKNDRFTNIIQRMSQFAAELLESKNIELKFSNDVSILSLSMEKRKSFYLLYKEAINNCAKYSKATMVDVNLSQKENIMRLTIKDNGEGFDTAKTYTGNGMKTMHKRATELNGVLKIDSALHEGTAVQLNFTV